MRHLYPLFALALLLAVVLSGCGQGATGGDASTVATSPATVGTIGQVTATPIPPLTGQVTRTTVENHAGWEQLRAQDYAPDPTAIATIREYRDTFDVLLFIGTWCGDSKREVPRYFKIMDQAGLEEARLTIIGLDRTKVDADGLTERWGIEYVPTLIVTREGQELGRIVERPETTLEGDIAAMVSAGP